MKIKTLVKIFIGFGVVIGLTVFGFIAFYIKGLPYIVSHPKSIEYIQNLTKKYTNADLVLEKPVLHTEFSPEIEFKVEKIYLSKNNKKLLDLNKFNTAISLREVFNKNIIIKKLVAESIYADVNGIQSLIPQTEKKEQKSDWNFDIFDALLGVRECEILYSLNKDTMIHLKGEHIGVNNAEKFKRNVYFQLNTLVSRKNNKVTLKLKDNGRVFFKDKYFHIQECPLSINKSNIFINLTADKKRNFDINLYSKNFNLGDILDFLNTQIIENNIQDSLVYFNDIYGNLDFKLNIKKDAVNGNFKVNKVSFKIKDVDNIPITLNQGNVDLTPNEVKLKGFKGYYDDNLKNKIDFEGTVKDYLRSIDTDIVGNAVVRNNLLKKHISKMAGANLEMIGEAPTRIMFKSKNNIMDFVWLFMLKPGQNIKVADDYLPFEDSLRLMKSVMHLENMVLDIKSLDYHMIPSDKILSKEEMQKRRAKKEEPQPIFRLKSSVDLAHNNFIKFVSFEIPQPLPSELLNVVLKQEIFKKGKIAGKMSVDYRGKYPVLDGLMSMDKVIIPSQMLYIKEAELETKKNLIHMNAIGGYRYSKFTFNGDVLNKLSYPIIVKDVSLSLKSIDTYKLLEAFNNQDSASDVIATETGVIKVDNPSEEFDIRNVIVEKGHFHLDEGSYKEIAFSNLDADLTLDKNGVIDIKSNRFDFVEGTSSLRAKFDLINKKYNVKLGFINVNSDTIANALLDLKREICGKAKGFLDLSTDDTMKLSGSIKFQVDDGNIEKIGLVEYVLKCASIFRNTVTMINPLIFADILSVPEGHFDKITGNLNLDKNVVTNINIKTYSSGLSNYISGRYNIDNGDTSLRVYTKFSNSKKGFTGFLRKISLNSLANRLPISSRNDANYYAIELSELPEIDADEKDTQIYLTRVEGDVVNNNYISSLKKLK
ncbi:hypothetical protein IJ541_00930 [bacterium]|nr:hypothetical protein [bacterium]